jgi:hypothetical protein
MYGIHVESKGKILAYIFGCHISKQKHNYSYIGKHSRHGRYCTERNRIKTLIARWIENGCRPRSDLGLKFHVSSLCYFLKGTWTLECEQFAVVQASQHRPFLASAWICVPFDFLVWWLYDCTAGPNTMLKELTGWGYLFSAGLAEWFAGVSHNLMDIWTTDT